MMMPPLVGPKLLKVVVKPPSKELPSALQLEDDEAALLEQLRGAPIRMVDPPRRDVPLTRRGVDVHDRAHWRSMPPRVGELATEVEALAHAAEHGHVKGRERRRPIVWDRRTRVVVQEANMVGPSALAVTKHGLFLAEDRRPTTLEVGAAFEDGVAKLEAERKRKRKAAAKGGEDESSSEDDNDNDDDATVDAKVRRVFALDAAGEVVEGRVMGVRAFERLSGHRTFPWQCAFGADVEVRDPPGVGNSGASTADMKRVEAVDARLALLVGDESGAAEEERRLLYAERAAVLARANRTSVYYGRGCVPHVVRVVESANWRPLDAALHARVLAPWVCDR